MPDDRNFVTQHLFEGFEMKDIVFTSQRDGFTGLARPGGAPDPVHVALGVLGQIVVDHVGDVFDMNTPRGHVGGHQNFHAVLLELVHKPETLALGQIAGNAFRRQPVAAQFFGQPLDPGLGIGKNQHPVPVLTFQNAQKERQLAFQTDMNQGLVNVLDRNLLRCNGDEFGQIHVLVGQLEYPVRQGGREKHGLAFFVVRQFAKDKTHIPRKPEIEQAVGFVDDYHLDSGGFEDALFEIVDDATGCADDHIDTLFQGLGLLLIINTADDLGEAQSGVRADQHGLFVNLRSQLPRRGYDDGCGQVGRPVG